MLSGIRNVLRHLRQEIQWIKDLEVALRTGQQVITGGFGKASELVACLPKLPASVWPRTTTVALADKLSAFRPGG